MRKLASIQKLTNIQPIEGKDRILSAQILGWTVIIGKDIYKEGDFVIFCEIDSKFPETEDWADLEKFKYRIKTFKVNTPTGPIFGQGYCLPLTILEKYDNEYPREYQEGEEVTHLLGITKYEPPEPADMSIGNSAGVFPTQYISKTDETRLESCLRILEEIKGKPYYISMKIDGSSISMLKIDEDYVVCSRNNMIKHPEGNNKSHFWDMFYKYPRIKDLLDEGFALQGEIYGEGIQKNHLKMKGKHLAVFNIIDLKTRRCVDYEKFITLCSTYEIPSVPIIETGMSFNHTFESLKELSDNLKYDSGNPAEGIVIRPMTEEYSYTLRGRLSFKQISRIFLSKGGD